MSSDISFSGGRDSSGRFMSWHERWARGLIPDSSLDKICLEGVYGEVVTFRGGSETTRWPRGDETVRTKKWYLENYYDRNAEMREKQSIDAIEGFCKDIRDTLASADFGSEEGVADALRDVRIRLENIEGAVSELRNSPSGEKKPCAVFREGDVVRYRGSMFRVESVIERTDGIRPWFWYDLREQYGDGEQREVPESSLVRGEPKKGKAKKPLLQRFFRFSDVHGDDVLLNVFRIEDVTGNQVTMPSGKVHALTSEQADELREIVGVCNRGAAE